MITTTDYLVIGAGAASLSFVDTILTECPESHVTIVDMHDAPGGHWNDAYDYVHLHQPSLLYGVASKQLEGNWLRLMLAKRTLPWKHRASKTEILAHYKKLVNKWVGSGSVSYYPKCQYDFSKKPAVNDDSNIHTLNALDGSQSYQTKVRQKLVNGIIGECRVPSKTPLPFHVDASVQVQTPNQLYEQAVASSKTERKTKWIPIKNKKIIPGAKKFVVLGCGKTAMDAVVFLQRKMGIPADNISWVIPNDVWILRREGPGTPESWPKALLHSELDVNKAALLLEAENIFTRIDSGVLPTKYRFPVVGEEELSFLRKVDNKIRQGRMTGITNLDGGKLRATFQKGEPMEFASDVTFVHCASPGPFNGFKHCDTFASEKELNLVMLMAPPVPISMSCLAVLEGRRRKGLLDLDFGRHLLAGSSGNKQKQLSDNDVLKALITRYHFSNDVTDNPLRQVDSLTLIGKLIAIFGKDPKEGHAWLSTNRLSMLSVPGIKSNVYETMQLLLSKKDLLNLSATDEEFLTTMAGRLQPLIGM